MQIQEIESKDNKNPPYDRGDLKKGPLILQLYKVNPKKKKKNLQK